MKIDFAHTLRVVLVAIGVLVGAAALAAEPPTPCPAQDSAAYYFPASLGVSASEDQVFRGTYSAMLHIMKEPSLSCGDTAPGYRFLWLRTFHHPVAVRLTVRAGHGTLQATELSGAAGYQPGSVLRRVSRELESKAVARVQAAWVGTDLWKAPVRSGPMGFDGSEWIVEARDGSRYHAVSRWSPKEGPVREFGLLLLSLTGWQYPSPELY